MLDNVDRIFYEVTRGFEKKIVGVGRLSMSEVNLCDVRVQVLETD